MRLRERVRLVAVLMLASACAAPTAAPVTSPAATPLTSPTSTPLAVAATVEPTRPLAATQPAGDTPTLAPSLTPQATPTATPTVAAGQVLSIYQTIGLTFIDPRQGWLLASGPCLGQVCPVTLRQTRDGGQTWAGSPAPATQADFFPAAFPRHAGDPLDVTSIQFASARDGWAFGPSLYSTHDGGHTWLNENRLVSNMAVTNGAIWAVEQKGNMAVVERSTDLGRTWPATAMQPLLVGWPSITSVSKETAWLFAQDSVLNPQLIVTYDGGLSWSELQMPLKACPTAVVKAASALFLWYACGGVGATSMQAKQVYTSSDGGVSWQLRANSDPLSPKTGDITNLGGLYNPANFFAPSAFTAFMALSRGTLIMTADGGLHWTDAIPYARLNGGIDPAIGPVAFANARDGWLAAAPNRIFRTTDGGHTWTETAVP